MVNKENILKYFDLLLKIKEATARSENLDDCINRINNELRPFKLNIYYHPSPKYANSENEFSKLIQTSEKPLTIIIKGEEKLTNLDISLFEIIYLEIKEFLKDLEVKNKKENIRKILEKILEEIEKVVNYTSANIGILYEDKIKFLAFRGYEKYNAEEFIKTLELTEKDFYTIKTVISTKSPLLIENTDEYPNWVYIPETSWIKSHLIIPIIYNNKLIGIIGLDSNKPYAFTQEDIEKLSFMIPIIGLAIENAKLYEQLEKELEEKTIEEKRARSSLYQVIKVSAELVELKDPYTSGHQKRVAKISSVIGKILGFSQEMIRFLNICALLHDIGKLAIPSEILNKPGPLSPLKKRLVNTHTEIGYNILKRINILGEVAPVIYQHHERLNGSGYPLGLKNGEILIEARIIAVADVVEAMTSHRPYRPALPLEVAIDEIKNNRGILYDPDVVSALLYAIDKGRIRL